MYSEKEVMIFNGVTKLLSQGIRLHSIKVSDIAEAAGIGKGTIYDYFESKEEIIQKSLLYNFHIEIMKAYSRINAVDGFKNKCYTLFDIIENREKSCSPTSLLLSDLSLSDFTDLLKNHQGMDRNRDNRTIGAIRELVALGIKEGIIKEQSDKDYQTTVFLSVLSGFINFVGYSCINNRNLEEEKARAYTLLIKGLN